MLYLLSPYYDPGKQLLLPHHIFPLPMLALADSMAQTMTAHRNSLQETHNGRSTPLLEVDHVWKLFGSVIALKDISMTLHAGEVMCLLGDKGAGKSILIKILSGVHRPAARTIEAEAQDLHETHGLGQ